MKIGKEYRIDLLPFILFLTILVLIAIAIVSLRIITTQGSKCVANPIKTAGDGLAIKNNQNVMCTCQGLAPNSERITYTTNFSTDAFGKLK